MYTKILPHSFQKCGFNSISEETEFDKELNSLLTQILKDDCITIEKFILFDYNLTTLVC